MNLNPDSARAIADQALGHILADPDLVAALLAATGATPQGLRAMLGSDSLALACLDIVMDSDERVLAFAGDAGLRPQDIAYAHALLSGVSGE